MLLVNGTMTDDPPPPHAPPPLGPRRLHRSTDDRMWQGVCGGVAEYLGVDATVVRIGFVVLSILGGVGIVAYAAGWLLVPEAGQLTPPKRSPWEIAGLVILACLVLGTLDVWDGGPAFPLVLLVIGGVLVWGNRDDGRRGASAAAGGTTAPPPGVVVERTGPGRWSWAPAEGVPTATAATATPAEPRHVGRALAVATGGLLLATGAITGAVAASDSITPEVFLGLTLAAFGLVMAIGSPWGWTRPLAFGGMVVVLALAVASLVDVPLEGGMGERSLVPASADSIPTVERLAVGALDLDLLRVDPADLAGRTIEASVAMGELTVVVPAGLTVEVHADAGAGLVEVFGGEEDGTSVEVDVTSGESADRLVLDLEVGFGHVEVVRGA